MIRFIERLEMDGSTQPETTLTLPLEQRVKARLRVTLDDGREAGLFLDRGPILRDGQRLRSEEGIVASVRAAPELVSVVKTNDPLLFARACYHLGNRHLPLQILSGELRYQHDHVLDEMVRKIGLEPKSEELPFEPEPGAYGEHGTDHDHHSHHGHSHSHS